MRWSQGLGGVIEGTTMIFAPSLSGTSTQAVQAKVWNMGSRQGNTSRSQTRKDWMEASQFETRFACVSMTPLGLPVVPEV